MLFVSTFQQVVRESSTQLTMSHHTLGSERHDPEMRGRSLTRSIPERMALPRHAGVALNILFLCCHGRLAYLVVDIEGAFSNVLAKDSWSYFCSTQCCLEIFSFCTVCCDLAIVLHGGGAGSRPIWVDGHRAFVCDKVVETEMYVGDLFIALTDVKEVILVLLPWRASLTLGLEQSSRCKASLSVRCCCARFGREESRREHLVSYFLEFCDGAKTRFPADI